MASPGGQALGAGPRRAQRKSNQPRREGNASPTAKNPAGGGAAGSRRPGIPAPCGAYDTNAISPPGNDPSAPPNKAGPASRRDDRPTRIPTTCSRAREMPSIARGVNCGARKGRKTLAQFLTRGRARVKH